MTIRVFGFEIDGAGARVIVRREPICNACLSDSEVDAQIRLMKENLEALAPKMKRAIHDLRSQPLIDPADVAVS